MQTANPDGELGRPSPNILEALASLGQAASQAPTVEALGDSVYAHLSSLVDTTGFILALYEEASETVRVVRQVEAGTDLPVGSFPLGNGFTSSVIRTGRPLLIRNWSQEGPRVQVQFATNRPGLPESGLTVPMRHGDKTVGVISVQSYRPEAYDETDLATLQVVATQVGSAVESLMVSRGLNAELQRRLAELETVVASLSDGLLMLDAQGRVVSLNRAARHLLCIGDGSLVLGQPLDEQRWGQWPLCVPALADALAPAVRALRRGESLKETEIEVIGEHRMVLDIQSTPLVDAAGTPYGGVLLLRDVTGRREIERLKDEILSIASHDLRTPATAIRMQAQLLLKRLTGTNASGDGLSEGLRLIVTQTDRMVKMLNTLLDLSRLESGRLELERKHVDLQTLVGVQAQTIQSTSAAHQVVVSARGPVDGSWDEDRLGQVLQNLLSNAVKYSPDGGAVEVEIAGEERNVTVKVKDRGVGLAETELTNVFQRFYRAENAQRLEGTGLGLYICHGIIAAHGGTIWAESEGLGKGATFAFTIPRWAEVAAAGNPGTGRQIPGTTTRLAV